MKQESFTKGQKTQIMIIETALELCGKNGFHQTSIQMIADACKLSQGAVMQHFKSKTRLFEAIRSYVSGSNHRFVDGKILPTDDGLTALEKHMIANLDWALKNRSQASIIYFAYEAGIYDDQHRQTTIAAARLGSERILRYLYAAQREGLFGKTNLCDSVIVAQIAQQFLLGLVLRCLNEVKLASVPKPYKEQIRCFMAALAKT